MSFSLISGNRIQGGSGGGGGSGDGNSISFASRAAAIAATIDAGVSLISVLHSGQVLHYRRYTEGGIGETYAPLKTNGNTVFWSPASDFCPLHWGAAGDGIANDRTPLQDMMRFLYGTPATNSSMPVAFASQRPFVVTGHNRTYAIAAPLVWGKIGTAVDTGMIYNFRLKDIRLKAIAGDWAFPLIDNVPQRYMIMAGWAFEADYTDELSGIYDVVLDHVTFDMAFLTGSSWVCNTYQFVMNQCRYQHPGIGQVVCDTSVRTAVQGTRPFGYNTGNGAYTLIGPNIEGLVGESGASYPGGNTIETMGTIGIRIYTNDAKVDSWIASRVSTAADLWGGAMLISNPHPWSREVRIRPTANNIMISNAYLDYTKFILESFGHMFVGCHWILPTGAGADRGVELRASVAATTGEGLLFTGCTFGGESLDIRYTTTGVGTWVGDKARKVTLSGCKYMSGHTIAQMERFEDKHGITLASGAHWFSTGDKTIGEIRLVGDTLYVGKDRTVSGSSSLQLQSQIGDQPAAGIYAYLAGGMGLINSFVNGFIELSTSAVSAAIFIAGATGIVNIKRSMTIENAGAAANALAAASGDIRATLGGLSTSTKTAIAVTDTVAGFRATGASTAIVNTTGQAATSATLNLGRGEAGFLLRGACAGSVSSGAGISVTSAGVLAFVTSSDERLKTNFETLDPSVIDQFGVYQFEFIANPGVRAFGVKAQELREVLPELVHGSGIVEQPEDWEPVDENDVWEAEHFGVPYDQLVPLALACIKDLRARVKTLEGKRK